MKIINWLLVFFLIPQSAFADLNAFGECHRRSMIVSQVVSAAIIGVEKETMKRRIAKEINDTDYYKDRAVKWTLHVADQAYDDPVITDPRRPAGASYINSLSLGYANRFQDYCMAHFSEFGGKHSISR